MHNIRQCITILRAFILVTFYWCCCPLHVKGNDREIRITSIPPLLLHPMFTQTAGEDEYENFEIGYPIECSCFGNDECSSENLGSAYIWKDIIRTSSTTNITAAIDYADTNLCRRENGYHRVALETVEELDFLVNCFLCSNKTYFGNAITKWNIMTSGVVEVVEAHWRPSEVLKRFTGIWSTWEEDIDGSVPVEVVMLDEYNGEPIKPDPFVQPGSYSIFLVGDGTQHCDEESDTYLKWGLMSHNASGYLENLVGYVVCERVTQTITTFNTMATTTLHTTDTTATTTDYTTTTISTSVPASLTTIPTTTTNSTNPFTTTSTTSTTTTSTTSLNSTTPTTTTTTTTTTTPIAITTSTTTSPIATSIFTTAPTTIIECCRFENGSKMCTGEEVIECPPNYSGSEYLECIDGKLNRIDNCVADWINDIGSMIDAGNVSSVEIAEILKNQTDTQTNITQSDLKSIVSLVFNLTRLLEEQVKQSNDSLEKQELAYSYTNQMVKIEGNIFAYENVWDGLDKETSGMLGSSLLHDLEKTGFILASNVEDETMNFSDPSLNMTVLSKPKDTLKGPELFFPSSDSETFIRLPEDFDNQFNESESHVVSFFLEQKAAKRALPAALHSLPGEPVSKEVNSFMVSMTLGSLNRSVTFNEGAQVVLRLQHSYKESGPYFRNLYRHPRDGETPSMIPESAVCVYWNSNISAWVPDGCQLLNSSRDVTYCSCNHLSMISIITDVHNYMGRDATLDILGTVLSCLSCITLSLTIIIFQFYKDVDRSHRVSITKQLCVSLFFSHLFLILFIDRDFLKLSEDGCQVIAIVLHYLLMASICWMLAEGLQLLHTVHFTFKSTSFMLLYWFLGYGVPVVVVLVTVVAAFSAGDWKTQEAYAPSGSEYCWLTTEEGYIWAFTGPLTVIIVINAVFMIFTIRSATKLTKNKMKSRLQRILLYVKGSFSLNCILGVTWIFGLLYINSNHFFAYMFTIFNASQGIMIFIFNCILNDNVWAIIVSHLPKSIKKCFKNKTVKGVPTTGNEFTFNNTIHHKNCRQVACHTPHPNKQCHSTLNHQSNFSSRLRSHSDTLDLQRNGRQYYPEENSSQLNPSAIRLTNNCLQLTQETTKQRPVPAKVLPPDKLYNRRDSEWSADTQISFLSDGVMGYRTSLDSFRTVGYNSTNSSSNSNFSKYSISSNSSSNSSSSFSSSNIVGETRRIYPNSASIYTHCLVPNDSRIHTIPECEERNLPSESVIYV